MEGVHRVVGVDLPALDDVAVEALVIVKGAGRPEEALIAADEDVRVAARAFLAIPHGAAVLADLELQVLVADQLSRLDDVRIFGKSLLDRWQLAGLDQVGGHRGFFELTGCGPGSCLGRRRCFPYFGGGGDFCRLGAGYSRHARCGERRDTEELTSIDAFHLDSLLC